MKRARAMLISLGTLLAIGCGMKEYDYRIGQTLDRMKYDRRLDENLMPVAKGRFEELGIHLRPPKNMTGPTQTLQFATPEPGRFDLMTTFQDQERQSLHVLARFDQPKAAAKKDEAPQAEARPRGTYEDFRNEVVELIHDATGAQIPELKSEQKPVKYRRLSNTFQTATIDRDGREMQIYLYGSEPKGTPYKVALIFDYLKSEKNSVSSRIALTLENFLVGDPARQAFSGGQEEGDEGEAGGEAGPPI